MTKLTITVIGTPKDVQTKFGTKQKNYIKAKEHGDDYLSFWCSSITQGWKVNDVIEVEAVTQREYNGKVYHDIIMPKVNQALNPEVMKLLNEIAVRTLKTHMLVEELVAEKRLRNNESMSGKVENPMDYPTGNPSDDNDGIPF